MYFKKLDICGFKSFAEKTTLHFEPGITAIVGPNGCGKCLHYDSLVTLSDGSKIRIGELVGTAIKNSPSVDKLDDGIMSSHNPDNICILSLNPDTLKIEARPIYAFIKRKAPEYLLKIETRSGKRVVTTHYHPFFGIKDGQIVELKAEQLKTGVRIAVPRRFKTPDLNTEKESLATGMTSSDIKSTLQNQSINAVHFTHLLERAKISVMPDLDLLPGINAVVKDLVKLSGIKIKKIRGICPTLAAYYENRCLPTRQGLLESLSVIAEHGNLAGLAKNVFDYLKSLAHSDIYWDEVISIKKVYTQDWVYDLSILNTHNFIAQDIIVHNSNIFDSIRWCLGEQSIKSLRGARMEDVIFNGTETVPALSVAEVSLTISNEAKILPIDYEEVTITRRLFRSGESEYLINNNAVRLKDINELLMGTGIGAESYSLVEQGKIDLVISSKPEDRRLVFDEATGVSKYKAKKKEAMKKLEETDNNLLRVNDIITEVKRQIGSIERQASKARRYKEIFEKLKNCELKFSSAELKQLTAEQALLSGLAKKSYSEEIELNTQLQGFDKRLIQQQKILQELDAKLSVLKDEISQLENANERDRQHIHLDQDRVLDLNKHVDILASQKEQLKSKIDSHEKNIAELTEQLMSLHEVYAKKETDATTQETALAALLRETEAAREEIKTLKSKLFDLNLSESGINNQINENGSVMHTLLARQRRLETEKIKTSDESAALSQTLDGVRREIAAQKDNIGAMTKKIEGIGERKTSLEEALKKLEEGLRHLENEKLGLRSQCDFLKELKLKYDGMPQAKNGTLEIDEIPADKISGIIARAGEVKFDDASRTYRIACELKFISFDLQSLEARIEETAGEIESRIRQMAQQEKELMGAIKEMEAAEDILQQEKFNLTNKEAVSTNLSDNAKKIQDELNVIETEIVEVNEDLQAAKQKDNKNKEELNSIRSEIQFIDARMDQDLQKISANTGAKETLLVVIAQLRTELANHRLKEEDIQGNLAFFKDALAQDANTSNLHASEVEDSLEKIRELNQEAEMLELQIKTQKEEIDIKTRDQSKRSQTRIEEVNALDFTQKQIIDLEERADKVKEDNHRFQLQEQELNFKHANIKNRILQAYTIDLDETPLAAEASEGLDLEAVSQEIAALKEKVEAFGTVNLVAIEELEELKNRHDFLTQQQNDLLSAKDSLSKAILKINRTTRKMFLETFQIVAEEFKNHFKMLFGGGEARLFLIDEEDVLESGIEIICRPPGKKLQNITLLSGGEKALSAIALIFAIFKTKPSPFCVLDEIDAALDESNIDRFSRMLADFSKTSQFITITHNKKTISRANVMYGITMERSGMSKIVSVKLQENNHENLPASETPAKKQPSSETAAA